ncbi:MAG: hydroxymethylpyrimidine/phosphomethylpyrimidine kinase [Betaproteobacteria bacterium]|nr:hydroxymethylpyrimidine/phosphomethylpyrimidine kinase [Betaproteobacteria bacterium]
MSSSPPIVLSFAASDPSGGAGLQADLLTLASLGCHPATVLTALTVQDTRGVESVRALEPQWVERQARCLLADVPVAAVKLGVLGSAANAAIVAAILGERPALPVVLDPVLASGRGDALADAQTVPALCSALLPLTTVLTPNSLEARRLVGAAPDADLGACARRLVEAGCRYVLVSGTHEAGAQVVNTLFSARGVVREDRWQRLPGSYHGSGCTLASAISAFLARGSDIVDAVREAQDYTWRALAAGFRPGKGQLLPNRFHDEAARPVRDHA